MKEQTYDFVVIGSGFGGSVWAMIDRCEAEEFQRRWQQCYRTRFAQRFKRAEFYLTQAGPPMVALDLR